MIKDECPENTENIAHEKPEVWFEWPYIFYKIIYDSNSYTCIYDSPNSEKHSWRSYPKMKLIRGLFIFICAL